MANGRPDGRPEDGSYRRGGMVLPVGCSRCGDTRLRREPAARQRASCRHLGNVGAFLEALRYDPGLLLYGPPPATPLPGVHLDTALLTAFHRRGRDFWIWRRRRNSCAGRSRSR